MNTVLFSHAWRALHETHTVDEAIDEAHYVIQECYRAGDRGLPWESCSRVSVSRAVEYVLAYMGPNGPRG